MLLTPTIWFLLDRKQRSPNCSRKIMETFDSSDSNFHSSYDSESNLPLSGAGTRNEPLRSRPFPIVLAKYWKVAHWNAKKLLPKFQKLPPKFLDIFIQTLIKSFIFRSLNNY